MRPPHLRTPISYRALILMLMERGPTWQRAVAREIARRSDGQFHLTNGGTGKELLALLEAGLIRESASPHARARTQIRMFELTPAGVREAQRVRTGILRFMASTGSQVRVAPSPRAKAAHRARAASARRLRALAVAMQQALAEWERGGFEP